MAEAEAVAEDGEEPPKKKSKAMLFGLIGAIALGGATFFGVYSGMIPLPFGGGEESKADAKKNKSDDSKKAEDGFQGSPATAAAFIPIEDIVISLGPNAGARHLKVSMSVEVVPEEEAAVVAIMPRVIDVLNTFLRAVDAADLENPAAMTRLRAQMLRRVRLVAPAGAVRDVLIQEFMLN